VSRRAALMAVTTGTVVAGAAVVGGTATSKKAETPKLWTLEGVLKAHPKYLYRYYLDLGNGTGQNCALYGADHGREPDQLARLKLPVIIRVRGALGTEHFSGGTEENPSRFSKAWTLYMDVHEVEVVAYFRPRRAPNE
ncbi:MAG: hypothetical protein ACREHD_11295, partial [Pirellulales bacterium]